MLDNLSCLRSFSLIEFDFVNTVPESYAYSNELTGALLNPFWTDSLAHANQIMLIKHLDNIIIGFIIVLIPVLFFTLKNHYTRKQKLLARLARNEIVKSKIEARDKERNRIAQELHDSLANRLVGIKYQLANMYQGKKQNFDFEQIVESVDSIYKEVRNISHNLILPNFSESNLEEVLGAYIKCYESDKLKIYYTVYPIRYNWTKADKSNHLEVYRIVQELLANSLKHANATEIYIQLLLSTNILTLTFEDNGSGFDIHKAYKGVGLRSIKTRIACLKGNYNIDSVPGKGTSVTIQVPNISYVKEYLDV